MPYLKEGTIRKRKDGRWEIRYMDNGKQRSVLSRNQAQCVALFNQRVCERDNRPYEAPAEKIKTETSKLTLFSMLDTWFANEVKANIRLGKKREKGKVSKNHAKNYRVAIELHIKKHFENKCLDKVTVFDLEENSKKIEASRTRENVDSVLNLSLNWAHKMGLMSKNITTHFRKHKHDRKQGKPFTRADQERILEYARQHSKYYFQFVFYFNTGCRPSEIRAVRHCDFDFENGTIFIDGTKTETSSRKVPMFAPIRKFRENIKPDSTDFVFTNKIDTLREDLHSILIALEIANPNDISTNDNDNEKYTLKSTRHSFATRLKESGIDMKVISMWMGHNNIQMTGHYAQVLGEFEQMQADKFNALIDVA